jgi:TM2 domain-containing membrane protein YozV
LCISTSFSGAGQVDALLWAVHNAAIPCPVFANRINTSELGPMASGPVGRGKNKLVAGLLGIFLGWLGVHHYYLGSVMAGVIVLILSCCFGIGSILGLVEGILLLVMSDEDFDAKYNLREPESMEFVFSKPK